MIRFLGTHRLWAESGRYSHLCTRSERVGSARGAALQAIRSRLPGAMTSSAKRPRDYAVAPRVFGRAPNIDWHEATPDVVELMAAKIQHQQAWLIRDAIYREFPVRQGTRLYADAAGRDYDQLNRMLRGEITIKIYDLAAARRVFGDHINLNTPILGPTTSRPPLVVDRTPDPEADAL